MNEVTSADVAAIAARGLTNPATLTLHEIQAVCGSALTQRESRLYPPSAAMGINALCAEIHGDNLRAGWWTDPHTGASIIDSRNVGEMLMLIVSEVAEAMEGHRKGLMDDKLPHRLMFEVELADACIRIFDLAGAKGFDLGGAIAEKRAYNAQREDHKIENRIKPGGKAY